MYVKVFPTVKGVFNNDSIYLTSGVPRLDVSRHCFTPTSREIKTTVLVSGSRLIEPRVV